MPGTDSGIGIGANCFDDPDKYPLQTAFQAAFVIEREAMPEYGTIMFDCAPIQAGKRKLDRICNKTYEYDETFAPQGKTVLQANLSQFDDDYAYWSSLDRDSYTKEKQRLTAELEQRILAEFPSLRGSMEWLDSWTPLTYTRYCKAYHGVYMSFINKRM